MFRDIEKWDVEAQLTPATQESVMKVSKDYFDEIMRQQTGSLSRSVSQPRISKVSSFHGQSVLDA
jgi:hypothetical protein